jgi:Oligosaccharide biosynthesis protein Alg14 like
LTRHEACAVITRGNTEARHQRSPTSTRTVDAPTRVLDVLFVSSAGGHLAQLLQLSTWYEHHRRHWVTFDLPDATSLLVGEATTWAYHPTTRNVPNLLRNLRLAWTVLRRERPNVIVSSGAAVAVPFFVLGKLFGARTVYLEVIDRLDTRTLTARLCSPFTDVMVVQDHDQAALFKQSYVVGRLL